MSVDKGALIAELIKRLEDTPPLEGEDFLTVETITRYLKSSGWNIDAAEKSLLETLGWRRMTKPQEKDCSWCHDKPGYHNMRQVGFDEVGRPVIYACIAQATSRRNTVDDVIAHVTYLVENAQNTMAPGITTWTFVIDCAGMRLQACNPKLGYGVIHELAKHYPERLGEVIVIKPNALFRAVWKPLKMFLDPVSVRKMKLVKKTDQMLDVFQSVFPDELSEWLAEEIRLNRMKPFPKRQREFWKVPTDNEHDPRACPSFVREYIDVYNKTSKYRPHPNIIDYMHGKTLSVVMSETSLCDKDEANGDDDAEDSDSDDTIEISAEFQITDEDEKLVP